MFTRNSKAYHVIPTEAYHVIPTEAYHVIPTEACVLFISFNEVCVYVPLSPVEHTIACTCSKSVGLNK